MRHILLALLLAGCTVRDVRPVPPQPHGGTCETAHASLTTLGGCGANLPRFVQDCEDRQAFNASRGRGLALDCLTEAKSCEEALSCRGR